MLKDAQNGNVCRAPRALDSSPVLPVDKTLPKLRALYPKQAPPARAGQPAPETLLAKVDAVQFTNVLMRLKYGTAAGLSGTTHEHIRHAALHDPRAGGSLRGFVNNMLSGSMDHNAFLLASRLVALEKPNGGVRPIAGAMGEALIRLASICALTCVLQVALLLKPLLVDVGIPGGVEIPGHALRPDSLKAGVVTVSIDLTNALNVGDRDLILTIVADLLPELYLITRLLCSQASALLARQPDGDNAVLWSQASVRQGDPLGMLLFELSFLPTLLRARESAP